MSSTVFVVVLAAVSAGPAGQIAYVSGTEQEDQRVCVIDLVRATVTHIGPGERDGAPVWSPDGAWLAFHTKQPDGLGICVARPDGSDCRRLTHRHVWNQNPRWSPDGAMLAYAADDGEPFQQRIMVYDIKTGTESQWGGDRTNLMRPVWAPNMKLLHGLRPDQEIELGDQQTTLEELDWLKATRALTVIGITGELGAFSTDIFIVTAEMAVPFPAAFLPSPGRYAEWAVEPSPDGKALAFESNDGGDREIFVLSIKGPADITNHRTADWNPVWSPDSDWIAFESFRSGRRGVYRAFPATARVFPVAVSAETDNWWPTWSTDGKWIAFVSDRTGDPEVFVTDLSGDTVIQITDHPGPDYAPAWRPEEDER